MKACIAPILAASLAGCAVYSVNPAEGAPTLHPVAGDAVQIVKLNRVPQGFQCFEPYWYFMTAGIVPTRCVDTYQVSLLRPSRTEQSTYTLTAIAGWEALFLMPFSGWHAGTGDVPPATVEKLIRQTPK